MSFLGKADYRNHKTNAQDNATRNGRINSSGHGIVPSLRAL